MLKNITFFAIITIFMFSSIAVFPNDKKILLKQFTGFIEEVDKDSSTVTIYKVIKGNKVYLKALITPNTLVKLGKAVGSFENLSAGERVQVIYEPFDGETPAIKILTIFNQ